MAGTHVVNLDQRIRSPPRRGVGLRLQSSASGATVAKAPSAGLRPSQKSFWAHCPVGRPVCC